MSLRSRFVLPLIALLSLAFLAGCGSSSNKATPPPSGGFSKSNLSGTYVFSVVGLDNAGDFLAMTGTLTADGNGNLTGGTFDLNNPNGVGTGAPLSVGAGSRYSVTTDGRGSATVNASIGTIGFDFVLTSNEGGLITEFDGNGTGSGTLDLQSTVSQADIAGSYAFNFSGTSGIGASVCGVNFGAAVLPLANVGAFTLDSNGNITGGVEDFNNNCSSTGTTALAITGGSVSLATVPGTAVITSNAGTFNFDVYPVTSSHLKFVEIDSTPVVAGSAFSQSSSLPSGPVVFSLSGFDSVVQGPFTAAGILSGGSGIEDINDLGAASSIPSFTASYDTLSGGRSVLHLTGFANGGGGLGCTDCQFAVYPSTGGLQIMEIDNGGITDGAAYTQSSTSLAASEGYGVNLSGVNLSFGAEEDDIAEFTNTSGNFSGLIDFNDGGLSTAFDQKFSAVYTADSTADGRGTVAPGSNSYNLVTYVVDGSTVVVLSSDPNYVALGTFALQNSSAKSNAAKEHLAVLRPKLAAKPGVKSTLKRR